MLYTIDRVQYANANNQYYFYEFMEVSNINSLVDNQGNLLQPSYLWDALFKMISDVEQAKINFLKDNQRVVRVFIFYQQGLDRYIKIEINPNGIYGNIWTYIELQKWFRWLNNIDGQSNSKELGAARDTNLDTYLNGILRSLYKNNQFQDDNGLELTKNLLNGDSTKGFDLDLFQYIPSTGEYVIYEFLKRENKSINNIQAHPMRYCWTDKWNDNKQKFKALWNAKQFLNGRLLLINYSDNESEKISIIEVLDLDNDKGILAENKYSMSRNVFLGWLHDMSRYTSPNREYLSDFKVAHYDVDFFENFSENKKKKYGAEFSNIYI
ncbi:hypothetical protein BCJMU51_5471 [Bacillus cereus]|uniref:hypothetical protein n=1 Tax=Bacillus cereus TaxID=1396 RepID=UPI001F38BD5A|nr:hypothetical protein [Bacillus cereus]BCB40553.1 hypothetical protein BCM0045_5448 [Bacillus cereus]BCC03389.1 hypothetical protein BCM0057_5471 [Bacillus cereus]BCC26908.1 hypothetical protein BCM0079_5501 [Bacillus cereus]BCC38468.1 hypothetical protein BCM0105_5458 [Bacillus cereus]BCC44266.1 hypothetical protein BCJMU01_5433 [Bacillus cereus]